MRKMKKDGILRWCQSDVIWEYPKKYWKVRLLVVVIGNAYFSLCKIWSHKDRDECRYNFFGSTHSIPKSEYSYYAYYHVQWQRIPCSCYLPMTHFVFQACPNHGEFWENQLICHHSRSYSPDFEKFSKGVQFGKFNKGTKILSRYV